MSSVRLGTIEICTAVNSEWSKVITFVSGAQTQSIEFERGEYVQYFILNTYNTSVIRMATRRSDTKYY